MKECYLKSIELLLTHLPLFNDVLRGNFKKVKKVSTPEEIEPLLLRAQQIYLNCFPTSHYYLSLLRAISSFHLGNQQDEKAVEMFLQAYQICFERWPQTDRMLNITIDLARLDMDIRRNKKGEEYYLQVLAAQDTNSHVYADCLLSLAGWYRSSGRKEAEDYYLKASQAYAAIEAEPWKLVKCLKSLAKWHAGYGRREAAIEYGLKALQASAECGKESLKYAHSFEHMAKWYADDNQKRAAENCYLQAGLVYFTSAWSDYEGFLETLSGWYALQGRTEASEVCSFKKQQHFRVFGRCLLRDLYT